MNEATKDAVIEQLAKKIEELQGIVDSHHYTQQRADTLSGLFDKWQADAKEIHELQHRLWAYSESNEMMDLSYRCTAEERDYYKIALLEIAEGADDPQAIARKALLKTPTDMPKSLEYANTCRSIAEALLKDAEHYEQWIRNEENEKKTF